MVSYSGSIRLALQFASKKVKVEHTSSSHLSGGVIVMMMIRVNEAILTMIIKWVPYYTEFG